MGEDETTGAAWFWAWQNLLFLLPLLWAAFLLLLSATKQAEARLQMAEAEAQACEMVAKGERAQQMVSVNVEQAGMV